MNLMPYGGNVQGVGNGEPHLFWQAACAARVERSAGAGARAPVAARALAPQWSGRACLADARLASDCSQAGLREHPEAKGQSELVAATLHYTGRCGSAVRSAASHDAAARAILGRDGDPCDA